MRDTRYHCRFLDRLVPRVKLKCLTLFIYPISISPGDPPSSQLMGILEERKKFPEKNEEDNSDRIRRD